MPCWLDFQTPQLTDYSESRLMSKTPKRHHITPVLKDLHWLKVKYRIDFKILLLVFKTYQGMAPGYICDLLIPYKPSRTLRSGDKSQLAQPRSHRHTLGDRAFSIYAPRVWNALPLEIRQSPSVASFKKRLKTFFFRQCYK